jgi:hypothetical protein
MKQRRAQRQKNAHDFLSQNRMKMVTMNISRSTSYTLYKRMLFELPQCASMQAEQFLLTPICLLLTLAYPCLTTSFPGFCAIVIQITRQCVKSKVSLSTKVTLKSSITASATGRNMYACKSGENTIHIHSACTSPTSAAIIMQKNAVLAFQMMGFVRLDKSIQQFPRIYTKKYSLVLQGIVKASSFKIDPREDSLQL